MVRLALAAARDGGRGLRVRGKALVWVSELAQAHTHTRARVDTSSHFRAQALTLSHKLPALERTEESDGGRDGGLGWRKGWGPRMVPTSRGWEAGRRAAEARREWATVAPPPLSAGYGLSHGGVSHGGGAGS